MTLNIENIKKALEWCIQSEDCEYCEYNKGNIDVCSIKGDALALIKDQAEQIFKLENRLKECENGYEQTLHLERAKIKQLTEDNKWSANRIIEADKMVLQLNAENGRLIQEKTALECIVATARNQAKREVSREIFEESYKILDKFLKGEIIARFLVYNFDELKKKYIGDQI